MSTGPGKRVGEPAVRPCPDAHRPCMPYVAARGQFWIGLPADPPRPAKNPADLAGYDALITPEDREHWAFQPVKSPTAPG